VNTSRSRMGIVMVLVVVLTGCSQPLNTREKSTLVGGGLGAATGAIIGAAVGAPGPGAAIGGGVGALTGGLIGDQFLGMENRQYAQQQQIDAQGREIRRQRREIQRLKQRKKTTTVKKKYQYE
jgi:osmotically inducible lipoprotein OsmB